MKLVFQVRLVAFAYLGSKQDLGGCVEGPKLFMTYSKICVAPQALRGFFLHEIALNEYNNDQHKQSSIWNSLL